MKIYNLNTDKIENNRIITVGDKRYAIYKLSEAELNAFGYYYITYSSRPNERYYVAVESKELVGNVYTVTYTAVEKPLADVKLTMAKDLRATYYALKERPRVATGLGFDVYGGLDDIEEMKTWHEDAEDVIEDADDNLIDVSSADYLTIRTAVLADRKVLFHAKKTKVAELIALADIDACIYYEATPYQVEVDVLDEFDEPTGETEMVTRYKNNITDWS